MEYSNLTCVNEEYFTLDRNKRTIAIDLDGTITEYEEWAKRVGSQYFNKPVVNEFGYDLFEIFDVSEEEDRLFWNYYDCYYASDVSIKENAVKCIKKLHEYYNIIIMTSRVDTSIGISVYAQKCNVVKYLDKYKVIFDGIVFTDKSKKDSCSKYFVSMLIDDSPKHINDCNNTIHSVCMGASYNINGIDNKNSIRVSCWSDSLVKDIRVLMGE